MVLDEETRLRFSFFISKYCNRTLNPGCWTPDPGRREEEKIGGRVEGIGFGLCEDLERDCGFGLGG